MTSVKLLNYYVSWIYVCTVGFTTLPSWRGKIQTDGCKGFPTVPVTQEDLETVG